MEMFPDLPRAAQRTRGLFIAVTEPAFLSDICLSSIWPSTLPSLLEFLLAAGDMTTVSCPLHSVPLFSDLRT